MQTLPQPSVSYCVIPLKSCLTWRFPMVSGRGKGPGVTGWKCRWTGFLAEPEPSLRWSARWVSRKEDPCPNLLCQGHFLLQDTCGRHTAHSPPWGLGRRSAFPPGGGECHSQLTVTALPHGVCHQFYTSHTSSCPLVSLKPKRSKTPSLLLNDVEHSHSERAQFHTVYYWEFSLFDFNLTHSLSLEGKHFRFREMQE